MTGRYDASGPESEFQPGSRGRVPRNRRGITSIRQLERDESEALLAATQQAIGARLLAMLMGLQAGLRTRFRRNPRSWKARLYCRCPFCIGSSLRPNDQRIPPRNRADAQDSV
jgi:hypothetical protein